MLYPESAIVVKLRSKVLPQQLIDTLIKKSEALIKKLVAEGKPQTFAVFEFIRTILENNNLIPAFLELPEIRKLLRLKADEKMTEAGKQVPLDEMKMFEK